MNFDYNEEQQLLADSVRRFLQKDYDFEKRRQILATPEGASDQVWGTFAQMGLTGLPLSPDYGGFGGGAVDLMSVMEAFGEALVVEPYLPTLLGALLVAKGGSSEQKQAVLPAVAEGRMKLAFAHSEPGSRYDIKDVRAFADKEIKGEKSGVLGAPLADKLVVSARTEKGIGLFLVERSAVELKAYRMLDDRAGADIVLANVKGEPLQGGLALIEEVIDFAAALSCAEAVGAMKYACDATLEYLKTRKQFGVPIGTFQALQHRIVDMYISQEQARSMACLACSKTDSSDARVERARAVSAAKIKIADSARHVGQEAVQLHGGMGMSEELKISHTFRRLTVLAQQFGDADFHLERFGAL
jgi:alkylation response protein AidB-like acyl-CoA dehydrogenase